MTDFNKVILLGRIGNDPELKTSSGGKPYMKLSIATHAFKRAGGKDNEQSDEMTTNRITHWHRVMVFGNQAENCAMFLKRGSPVLVEGSLDVGHYIDKNENKVTSVSVIANWIQFLGGHQRAEVAREEEALAATA